MQLEFTAVFKQVSDGGYVGFVEELPGANTFGETLDEVRTNLREAAILVIETNRARAEEDIGGDNVFSEPPRLIA